MPKLLTRAVCRSPPGDGADCVLETRRPLPAPSGHLSLIDRPAVDTVDTTDTADTPSIGTDCNSRLNSLRIQHLTVSIIPAKRTLSLIFLAYSGLDCQHCFCQTRLHSRVFSTYTALDLEHYPCQTLIHSRILATYSGLDCQYYPCQTHLHSSVFSAYIIRDCEHYPCQTHLGFRVSSVYTTLCCQHYPCQLSSLWCLHCSALWAVGPTLWKCPLLLLFIIITCTALDLPNFYIMFAWFSILSRRVDAYRFLWLSTLSLSNVFSLPYACHGRRN